MPNLRSSRNLEFIPLFAGNKGRHHLTLQRKGAGIATEVVARLVRRKLFHMLQLDWGALYAKIY